MDVSNALANKPNIKKPVVIKKTVVKDTVDTVKTCSRVIVNKSSPRERMAQFFKLKPDVSKPKTIHFTIEKPLQTPKDTLRCPACNKLFPRKNHEQHKKECKMKAGHKYGCIFCQYKHTDIEELRKHISNRHNHEKQT